MTKLPVSTNIQMNGNILIFDFLLQRKKDRRSQKPDNINVAEHCGQLHPYAHTFKASFPWCRRHLGGPNKINHRVVLSLFINTFIVFSHLPHCSNWYSN